jgi:hypothetical protein
MLEIPLNLVWSEKKTQNRSSSDDAWVSPSEVKKLSNEQK